MSHEPAPPGRRLTRYSVRSSACSAPSSFDALLMLGTTVGAPNGLLGSQRGAGASCAPAPDMVSGAPPSGVEIVSPPPRSEPAAPPESPDVPASGLPPTLPQLPSTPSATRGSHAHRRPLISHRPA